MIRKISTYQSSAELGNDLSAEQMAEWAEVCADGLRNHFPTAEISVAYGPEVGQLHVEGDDDGFDDQEQVKEVIDQLWEYWG